VAELPGLHYISDDIEGKRIHENFRAPKNLKYLKAAARSERFFEFLIGAMERWGNEWKVPLSAVQCQSPAYWTHDGRLRLRFMADPEWVDEHMEIEMADKYSLWLEIKEKYEAGEMDYKDLIEWMNANGH